MSERDEPTKQSCPQCEGELYRTMETGGLLSDSVGIHRRAGSEFNDRMKQIKKGSALKNTIKTI